MLSSMSTKNVTRAALYTRVSAVKRDYRSTAEQETELREQADREGWEIVRVFREPGRGASRHSRKTRPEYAKVLDLIGSGDIDLVATWACSRAQRDLAVYVQLRDACASNGVLWSYSGHVYDLTRGDDRFRTGLDALLSEREAEETRENVLRAVRANAAAGRPHGRANYGYRRVYDPETKTLVKVVKHPKQAAIVKEAARRLLAGESLFAVAADFTSRGIPTPAGRSRWRQTTVKRLVTNPTYIGKRTHHGAVVADALWPAILTKADYHHLVAKLNDPARNTWRETSIRHLLTGIANCGVCGSPVAAMRNRNCPSYACSTNFCVSRKESWVDDVVRAVLVERLSRPDALALFADDEPNDAVQAAMDEAAELQAELDGYIDTVGQPGGVSRATLAKIEARLQPLIDAANRRAQQRSTLPAAVHHIAGSADVGVWWDKQTLTLRREIIRALVKIEILPAGQGSRTFDPQKIQITWRR